MGKCVKIVRKIKRVCVGSLNKKIIIEAREIGTPGGGTSLYKESFTPIKTVWAMIETVKGLMMFDSTNIARDVSHRIYIRYDKTLSMTAERWITLPSTDGTDDVKIDVLRVENINEENRFFLLSCAFRGKSDQQSNFA